MDVTWYYDCNLQVWAETAKQALQPMVLHCTAMYENNLATMLICERQHELYICVRAGCIDALNVKGILRKITPKDSSGLASAPDVS